MNSNRVYYSSDIRLLLNLNLFKCLTRRNFEHGIITIRVPAKQFGHEFFYDRAIFVFYNCTVHTTTNSWTKSLCQMGRHLFLTIFRQLIATLICHSVNILTFFKIWSLVKNMVQVHHVVAAVWSFSTKDLVNWAFPFKTFEWNRSPWYFEISLTEVGLAVVIVRWRHRKW